MLVHGATSILKMYQQSQTQTLTDKFHSMFVFSPPVKVTLWHSAVRILSFVFTSLKTSLGLTQLVGQNKTFEVVIVDLKKKARFLHVNDTINVHKDAFHKQFSCLTSSFSYFLTWDSFVLSFGTEIPIIIQSNIIRM